MPDMIVLTSAKSRLIMPGHEDQVGDALHRLAQHVVGDAERLGQRRAAIDEASSRSLGMVIRVSTASRSSLEAALGLAARGACPRTRTAW